MRNNIGAALTREDAARILALPDAELPALIAEAFELRKKYKGLRVSVQILTNAKSGNCTEDCAYCAQSCVSENEIETYDMVSEEKLKADGGIARERGLARHCIGLSGLRFTDEQIEEFAGRIEALKQESSLPICCSIGFLTEQQAGRLKQVGVDRINHNLNSSEGFYPEICTTHTWRERIRNIRMLQRLGFEICSGGILGMGETADDVIDMFFALRDIAPQAVPVNFLLPQAGTPLGAACAGYSGTAANSAATDPLTSRLTPEYCLKALCLARIIMPAADIRCAAGREVYLKGREKDLFSVVDSIFASGYLTADGETIESTLRAIENAGFEYTVE
jgi:biotin synthase